MLCLAPFRKGGNFLKNLEEYVMDAPVQIKNENRAFYACAVAKEMSRPFFRDVVYTAIGKPLTYGLEHDGYAARMTVDATELVRDDVFLADIARAAEQASRMIHEIDCISGHLNDRMTVSSGPYRFEFNILGYWLGEDCANMVTDPKRLPLGARVGRKVELRVTHSV